MTTSSICCSTDSLLSLLNPPKIMEGRLGYLIHTAVSPMHITKTSDSATLTATLFPREPFLGLRERSFCLPPLDPLLTLEADVFTWLRGRELLYISLEFLLSDIFSPIFLFQKQFVKGRHRIGMNRLFSLYKVDYGKTQ